MNVTKVDEIVEIEGVLMRRVGARFTHPDQSCTEHLDYIEREPEPPKAPPEGLPWWCASLYRWYSQDVKDWRGEIEVYRRKVAAMFRHSEARVRQIVEARA